MTKKDKRENILWSILISLFFFYLTLKPKSAIGITGNGDIIRMDNMGGGEYNSPRSGNRKHLAIDIVCTPDQKIYSPVNGTVKRYSRPYADKPLNGILIKMGEGYEMFIWYIKPVVVPQEKIVKGQFIGIAQDVSKVYGASMKPHIHVQMRDKFGKPTDPTPFLDI